MNKKNKINVSADDLIFDTIGKKETEIINKAQNKILHSGFAKRAVISVIAAIVIAIGEYIGKRNQHIEFTMWKTFIFIAVAVIIFNLLSYGYIILKRKMDLYTDKTECLYCTVVEKYNQHKLSKENKKHAQNYILLETATYHCTTAFPIKDIKEFNKLSIGDTVLLIKTSPFGDIHYEIFTNINQ